MSEHNESAIFAAGCFWGVEASFRKLDSVFATAVGYIGGNLSSPTYEDVCSGRTNHAEAVRVEFDSSKISYEELLEVFWNCHDPTTENRQGPDVGTQYRSGIFFLNAAQKLAAKQSKAKLEASARFARPIVTEITQAAEFWRAENYHQQYFEKNGLGH
ncbi:MAG: peptide-methionine (S)-S-oxide reductase MsrA [bacterium]|nr:peptide-methionine (S)-S-oxide reductase MsrA [bacterium]